MANIGGARHFGLAIGVAGLFLVFVGFNLGLYGAHNLGDYKTVVRWAAAILGVSGFLLFFLGFCIQVYQTLTQFSHAAKTAFTDQPRNKTEWWDLAGRRMMVAAAVFGVASVLFSGYIIGKIGNRTSVIDILAVIFASTFWFGWGLRFAVRPKTDNRWMVATGTAVSILIVLYVVCFTANRSCGHMNASTEHDPRCILCWVLSAAGSPSQSSQIIDQGIKTPTSPAPGETPRGP
jgi:hypothetical protein